jgi:outer membrane protein assembly factor BamB
MYQLKLSSWICLWLILSAITQGNSQNWPGWRGPNGDGTSTEKNVPLTWDSVTNVIWKAEIPGIGHSSPIIWEDKLFTMSALPDEQERILLCYDARNGNLLWKKSILKAGLEDKHNDNSYASGTPATDGRYIYISFLDGEDAVVAAYDFNGKTSGPSGRAPLAVRTDTAALR